MSSGSATRKLLCSLVVCLLTFSCFLLGYIMCIWWRSHLFQTLQASFSVERLSPLGVGICWGGAKILVPVSVQLCCLCAALSVEVSVDENCLDNTVDVFSGGKDCCSLWLQSRSSWSAFLPSGKLWLRGYLLALGQAWGSACGGTGVSWMVPTEWPQNWVLKHEHVWRDFSSMIWAGNSPGVQGTGTSTATVVTVCKA